MLAPKPNPTPVETRYRGEGPDPALLEACAQGDDDAWRALVAHYGRRVYALIRSQSIDPATAEEIAQAVFTTVSQHLQTKRYEERGRFEAWLFRVAGNRARDELRKRKRRGQAANTANVPIAAPPDANPTLLADQGKALQAAIERLSETDREIVQLRHHAQLSFKQIAEILSQPVGTCLARHHRALKKLRTILDPEGDNA